MFSQSCPLWHASDGRAGKEACSVAFQSDVSKQTGSGMNGCLSEMRGLRGRTVAVAQPKPPAPGAGPSAPEQGWQLSGHCSFCSARYGNKSGGRVLGYRL